MLQYKNHLLVTRYIPLLSAENKLFEFISVDVSADKNCLRFTCFYIPPSTVVSYTDFYYACMCLSDCHTTCSPHFFCGDFNLPSIGWNIAVSVGNSAHVYFVELCNDLNVVEHICVPTHYSDNILDLLLCNSHSSFSLSSFEVCAPFSYTCDHCIISFKIQFSSTSRKHVHMPNFKSANYAAICDLSCQEWDALVSCCNNDVQLLHDAIIDKVNLSIAHHVPPKPIYSKPAIPCNVLQLLKEKKRLLGLQGCLQQSF